MAFSSRKSHRQWLSLPRGRYEPTYTSYEVMIEESKLIDAFVEENEKEQLGIKYSCFELVDAENTEAGANPGSGAASIRETS